MGGIGLYQETAITTQTRGRLVVMLYEGAVKFLKIAIREIEAENWGEKGKYIGKATDIINELNSVLDMEAGGEIATNLRKLYAFMIRHLGQANIKRDARMVQEVINLLSELLEGWRAIAV
ncbi:MAG: flagellar export chaperone FliS [Planctomycetes bacterium GWF2_42_9]|nr:MAG: flagellar export chaperone FliS [Planctomycetes bacterium GWF2_42_9]